MRVAPHTDRLTVSICDDSSGGNDAAIWRADVGAERVEGGGWRVEGGEWRVEGGECLVEGWGWMRA